MCVVLKPEDVAKVDNKAVICSDDNGNLLLCDPIPEEIAHYFVDYPRYEDTSDDPAMYDSKVPYSISKLQGITWLLNNGLYQTLIDKLSEDTTGISMILFNASSNWDRTSNMMLGFATALGLTEEQVDNIYIEASKILI